MLSKLNRKSKGYSKAEMLAYQKKRLKQLIGGNFSRHKNPTQLEILSAVNAKLDELIKQDAHQRRRLQMLSDREQRDEERKALFTKRERRAGMRMSMARIVSELAGSKYDEDTAVVFAFRLAIRIEQKLDEHRL